MTIFERPDEDVFADGARPGEVDPFPNVARGWGVALDQTGGRPPMEWFNWLGSRVDRAIRYFMQRGVAQWSSTETYPEGAIVQHNGIMYRADVENQGRAPDGSPGHWGAPWAPTVAADDSSKRVVNSERLAAALKTVQPALGFTPVRQGGGVNQANNIVKIGWAKDGSGVLITVDDTNFGAVAFAKQLAAYATQQWVRDYAAHKGGDTFSGRMTFGRDGWQADIALQNRRPGQNVSTFLRASDDGGIEGINWEYNAVTWRFDNWGNLHQRGQQILTTDGNLNLTWRGRQLSAEIDDIWNNIHPRATWDAVNGKANAGARVQVDSELAEFDYVGSVSSKIHGHIDLPAPWVVTGLRVNASTSSITAIWQRGVVLRNQ